MPEKPCIKKFKANVGSILTRQLFLILTLLTLIGSTYALGGTTQNSTALMILMGGSSSAIMTWALMWLFRKNLPLRIHYVSYYLLPFLLWSGLNTYAWSIVPWYSKPQWAMWLYASLFFICLINYNRHHQKDNQWLFFACILSGGLAGFIGYLQYFYQPGWLPLGQSIPIAEITGISGPFFEESNLAALMLITIPCAYSALRYPIFSTPVRVLMAFIFPFLILILLLTHEIWALLITATLFFILPFFCEERIKDRIKKSLLNLLIASLLLLYLSYTNPSTKEDLKNIPQEITQRFTTLPNSLNKEISWIVGEGFGYRYLNTDPLHNRQQNNYQNSWLTLINEEGILGFVLLVFPLLAIWIRFFRNWLKTPLRRIDSEKAYREKTETDLKLERELHTTDDPKERQRIQKILNKREQRRQHHTKRSRKKELPPIEHFYYMAIVPATFAFFIHTLVFNNFSHGVLLLILSCLLAIMFRVEQQNNPAPAHSIHNKTLFTIVIIGFVLYQGIIVYPEVKTSSSLNEGLSAWDASLRSPRITRTSKQLIKDAKAHLLETIQIELNHGDAQLALADIGISELSKHKVLDPTLIRQTQENLTKVLELLPNYWKSQYLALKFHLLINPHYPVSQEEIKKLENSLPEDANAWYAYAILQINYLNNPMASLSATQKALSIDPEHKKAIRLKEALMLD